MTITLLFLLIALTLAYRGAGQNGWSLWLLGVLLVMERTLSQANPLFWLAVVAVLTLLLLINHSGFRRRWLIEPAHRFLNRALPEISATEQAAIDAGTVSWDGELFSPRPDWQKLYSYPKPALTPEEQAFIDGPTEELCQMLDDWRITHERDDMPRSVWRFMKQKRFFGMIIDPAYGGLGFSALAHSTVVMKLSTRSISAAVTVMVPNSLGPAELLHRYGTQEQKKHYLPRLARGTEIPCFALTSPEAGSDAGAIIDRGEVCWGDWNGEQVLGFRINWNKRYITLAPVATLIGLAFKAYDPAHLLGEEEELGITCALIPANTPGVETGTRHRPLYCTFMNGPTRGKDVFIPLSQVIGGADFIGKGWSMLMNCLSVGRSVSLPALSTGAGKLCGLTSGAYAAIRQQFGHPIGRFEGIQAPMARIAALSYRMDAARRFTVNLVDQGEHPSVPSAILKYHNTEAMRQVVNDAMDIHGGRGIIEGPRNYLARVYQALPISITVEGANILTRNLMIFGQGAIRCHPLLLAEMQAARKPVYSQAIQELDKLLCQHIGRNLQAAVRALLLGITKSRLASPTGDQRHYAYLQHLERYCAAFVLVSDAALALLGGQLKVRESLSARLGDCLSHLYLASSALKHHADNQYPESDRQLLAWCMEDSFYQIELALDGVLSNFPQPIIGKLLRLFVFPTGTNRKPPSDALNAPLASLLMEPGEAQQRLLHGVYINRDETDPVGRLINAFLQQQELKGLEKRLETAIREGHLPTKQAREEQLQQALEQHLLTPIEAKRMSQADAFVMDALQVDEYRPTVKSQRKSPPK